MELRQMITTTTNKVEQYNQLCDWTSFGSTELVASNDDTEMEKAVKYTDLISNCIMLQNVIDMSDIIHQLTQEGAQIREEDIAFLSPYITKHINRYGCRHSLPMQTEHWGSYSGAARLEEAICFLHDYFYIPGKLMSYLSSLPGMG
jgi:hypothetical protein